MGTLYNISLKNYNKMTDNKGYFLDHNMYSSTTDTEDEKGNGINFEGKSFDQTFESAEIVDNYLKINLKNGCYIYCEYWNWKKYDIYTVEESNLSINFLKFGDEEYNIIECGLIDNPYEITKIGEDGSVNTTIFNDTINLSKKTQGATIDAKAGDDIIYAGKGDDKITGGKGDDYIKGGKGTNTVYYNIGDGYDTIEMTRDENLKIELSGLNNNDNLSYELNGTDVIINHVVTEGEGENAETTTTPILCLKNFGAKFKNIGNGITTTSGNTPFAGYLLSASSSSQTTTDKDYIPPITAVLTYKKGSSNYTIDLVNQLYDVKTTSDYTGTWLSERIDASEASSGVKILGKGGDDIIIGSGYDDIINGGAGKNTIIYTEQDFGNDTVILNANGSSDLTVDLSALPVNEQNSNDYPRFETYIQGKNYVITYLYYRLDDDGNRVQDEDGQDIIDSSSITFIELNTKKVAKDKGNVWIKFGDGEDDTIDIKNDVLPNSTPYYIFKNYKGTLLGDNISASGFKRYVKVNGVVTTITENHEKYQKTKGLSINGNYGNDIIVGSIYKDTIKGGEGNDEIYGGKGDDKLYGGNGNDKIFGGEGNDTLKGGNGNDEITGGKGNDIMYGGKGADKFIITSKADGTDTIKDATSEDTIIINDNQISGLRYVRNKNNLEIYYTEDTLLDQDNKIIIQNYFKSKNKITTIKLNGNNINIAEAIENAHHIQPAPPISPFSAYNGNYDELNSSVSSWVSGGICTDAGLMPDEPFNDDLSNLILAQVTA